MRNFDGNGDAVFGGEGARGRVDECGGGGCGGVGPGRVGERKGARVEEEEGEVGVTEEVRGWLSVEISDLANKGVL